jgi:hypothetical protein
VTHSVGPRSGPPTARVAGRKKAPWENERAALSGLSGHANFLRDFELQ